MRNCRYNGAVSLCCSMFALLALLLGGFNVSTAAAADPAPEKVAREMVQAWNELNLEKIVNTFAEDGVLHSVMLEPIKGRKAIHERLGAFLNGATRLELRLKNIAVVGNTVFLERVDDFDFKGKHGSVPVVGVMEISGGKVKEWREYYDHASLMREMGSAPAKH